LKSQGGTSLLTVAASNAIEFVDLATNNFPVSYILPFVYLCFIVSGSFFGVDIYGKNASVMRLHHPHQERGHNLIISSVSRNPLVLSLSDSLS
jgi:hypothetical protein